VQYSSNKSEMTKLMNHFDLSHQDSIKPSA